MVLYRLSIQTLHIPHPYRPARSGFLVSTAQMLHFLRFRYQIGTGAFGIQFCLPNAQLLDTSSTFAALNLMFLVE